MSTNPENAVRSPSYPVLSLSDAITAVGKIEAQYRASKVDREVAAKIIGYSGLSGPANKTLAALAQYGLVERAGKGEMKVTMRARAILHPDSEEEKRRELRAAALEPSLFREMQERWPDMIPPDEGVISYLNRRGFNSSAIRPAAKAYLQTLLFIEEAGATESHGSSAENPARSNEPDQGKPQFGGARIGDLIQWESGGALQFDNPKRVRLVSADGQFLAVDGSETGIPMSEVIVEQRAPEGKPQPPMFPRGLGELPERESPALAGEGEWMRNRLGSDTVVRLMVTGDMGPKEIGKLIRLLEAQKAILSDEDD